MKLAIMQPYLFPYLGYWQLINAVDKFVVLDDVNYIKGGWINRNKILLSGKEYLFTLPLSNASPNKFINEIMINNLPRWRTKFIRTLDTEYKKAPSFNSVFELITGCLNYEYVNLSAYITNSIKILCAYLGIKTEIIQSSTIYANGPLRKENRLFAICKQEASDIYVNSIGGQGLYDKSSFKKEGIDILFIKPNPVVYPQFGNKFVPNLSIIDVMMFNHKDEVARMLTQFELI